MLKIFKMYLPCYPLVLRNKYTDEITFFYTSDLRGDIINLQMDAMDITWILMAPSSKWGYENICHRQSIGTYFLILAHMEVFSELSAGWHVFWLFVMLFSPTYFQFKSVNISTILTSKLKRVYIWVLVSWLSLGIYIPWVESSVNKQIHLICVLFLDRTMRRNPRKYWYVMALPSTCKKSLTSDWLVNRFRRDF